MGDLISRSALLEKVWYADAGAYGDETPVVSEDDILEASAVEVRPVVHARWIGPRGEYTCSNCKSEAPDDGGYWASPYCPSCGAIMDLKSEGMDE